MKRPITSLLIVLAIATVANASPIYQNTFDPQPSGMGYVSNASGGGDNATFNTAPLGDGNKMAVLNDTSITGYSGMRFGFTGLPLAPNTKYYCSFDVQYAEPATTIEGGLTGLTRLNLSLRARNPNGTFTHLTLSDPDLFTTESLANGFTRYTIIIGGNAQATGTQPTDAKWAVSLSNASSHNVDIVFYTGRADDAQLASVGTWYIDNVTVEAVPEPGTFALVTGLGLVASIRRRARK